MNERQVRNADTVTQTSWRRPVPAAEADDPSCRHVHTPHCPERHFHSDCTCSYSNTHLLQQTVVQKMGHVLYIRSVHSRLKTFCKSFPPQPFLFFVRTVYQYFWAYTFFLLFPFFHFLVVSSVLPSAVWRCWLGGRKGIRPVKNWVVGC